MMKLQLLACLFLLGCVAYSPQNLLMNDLNRSLDLYEISSFDIYKDGETLHALISGLATEKAQVQSIRYLQSTDKGEYWSIPVEIMSPSIIADRGNDVQIATHGQNLVAVWQVQGDIPNSGALMSVYSHDDGKTWTTGKNPASNNTEDQSHADIIADQEGNFHSVWLADPEENGYQSLRYARSIDQGVSWQSTIKLDDSSCSCCWNTLAISNDDILHVLYRDMNPRDMVLLSSADHGATWQSKKTVGEFNWHFDGCPHIGGGIAFDDHNNFYASVWTGATSKSGLYSVTSNNYSVKISQNAKHSDIAVIKDRAVIVWDEMTKEGTGIFTSESIDKGVTWSHPHRLSVIGMNATHPRIVAVETHFLVLWTEKKAKQASQWIITRL